MENLANFTLGFVLNFVVAFVIVRFIYYPRTKDKRFVFTFLAFNMIIYFVLSLMVSIELGIGVGFGLFAIFSVLRYRTDPMPIREMTYLFIILALPNDEFHRNAGKLLAPTADCQQRGDFGAVAAGKRMGISV